MQKLDAARRNVDMAIEIFEHFDFDAIVTKLFKQLSKFISDGRNGAT